MAEDESLSSEAKRYVCVKKTDPNFYTINHCLWSTVIWVHAWHKYCLWNSRSDVICVSTWLLEFYNVLTLCQALTLGQKQWFIAYKVLNIRIFLTYLSFHFRKHWFIHWGCMD